MFSHPEPLASRLRPRALKDFVGQEHMLGEGAPLRKSIEEDALSSVIFAGPPGTGKTTLAEIIAASTHAQFVKLNAVMSGVKELKAVCGEAEHLFTSLKQRTALFIDEIHRFNKSQQDALLPYVERGTVILIGATTANPYFDVNAALISRSHVYLLKPLSDVDLLMILQRALTHPEGFSGKITIEDAALRRIAVVSDGDARKALNALELTVLTVGKKVTIADADRLLKERGFRYDRSGEDHYNTISAFIKTLRGSDPDAALVWLFKMIGSGEDPRFLFRRMMIFASEDIGNADPHALPFTVSAWKAFESIGPPEGEYFLAHACIYLAQAPKSNAVKKAISSVKAAIAHAPSLEVPNHLRNAPLKGMKEQGYGEGYQYPHDAEEGIVRANYFPLGMTPRSFYEPTKRGFENDVYQRIQRAKGMMRTT